MNGPVFSSINSDGSQNIQVASTMASLCFTNYDQCYASLMLETGRKKNMEKLVVKLALLKVLQMSQEMVEVLLRGGSKCQVHVMHYPTGM